MTVASRPVLPKQSELPRVLQIPVEDVATPLSMYVRLALFAIGHRATNCVDLRVPAHYLDEIIRAVRAVYPDTHSYLVEHYRGNGRVLLWRFPSDTSLSLQEPENGQQSTHGRVAG